MAHRRSATPPTQGYTRRRARTWPLRPSSTTCGLIASALSCSQNWVGTVVALHVSEILDTIADEAEIRHALARSRDPRRSGLLIRLMRVQVSPPEPDTIEPPQSEGVQSC